MCRQIFGVDATVEQIDGAHQNVTEVIDRVLLLDGPGRPARRTRRISVRATQLFRDPVLAVTPAKLNRGARRGVASKVAAVGATSGDGLCRHTSAPHANNLAKPGYVSGVISVPLQAPSERSTA
jgi:hypothetical protein